MGYEFIRFRMVLGVILALVLRGDRRYWVFIVLVLFEEMWFGFIIMVLRVILAMCYGSITSVLSLILVTLYGFITWVPDVVIMVICYGVIAYVSIIWYLIMDDIIAFTLGERPSTYQWVFIMLVFGGEEIWFGLVKSLLEVIPGLGYGFMMAVVGMILGMWHGFITLVPAVVLIAMWYAVITIVVCLIVVVWYVFIDRILLLLLEERHSKYHWVVVTLVLVGQEMWFGFITSILGGTLAMCYALITSILGVILAMWYGFVALVPGVVLMTISYELVTIALGMIIVVWHIFVDEILASVLGKRPSMYGWVLITLVLGEIWFRFTISLLSAILALCYEFVTSVVSVKFIKMILGVIKGMWYWLNTWVLAVLGVSLALIGSIVVETIKSLAVNWLSNVVYRIFQYP
ncbi:Cell wall protein [Actinidia chinensis var. chinensis]|uniref:Cell wall protein n=1 Tax=Actinidia chinensis var. chinensis TaxID=1590841 RepID=A0A2R6PVP6_ACTCC|nr:Cell wall protein [Actinidia chinensis var. chinensis]